MEKMIDWACDKDVMISFDREPVVQVRVIKPEMNKLERQSVIRYPFTCKRPLKVRIADFNSVFDFVYNFEIRENYCWDGASIPRVFWRLIGANTAAEFLIPSLIHDVLCENHQYIGDKRELSSKVFRALLIASGVNKFKAQIMYLAVDNFQKFKGKWDN